MLCFCSHSSSSASCQSSLPRNGVSRPFGSASNRSTASGANSPRSLAAGAYSASRTSSRYGPSQMGQRRHREVALRAVDHFRRNHLARSLFEHALAVVRGLEFGRAGGGQFDEFVVQERHPALQPPGHRHVVDPLDRIVDQHHGGVESQPAVHAALRAGAGEVLGDELSARVTGCAEVGGKQRADVLRCPGRRTPTGRTPPRRRGWRPRARPAGGTSGSRRTPRRRPARTAPP